MAVKSKRADVQYRPITPSGAGQYEVVHEGRVVGVVGRFRMSAGQFGSRWVATDPGRRRSGKYTTRDAAASWLVEQARASKRP